MDWQAKTIETYNNSAPQLAEYFSGIGSRVDDIERGLQLAGNPTEAHAVEIGCGDGRDAAEIVKRVGWYQGVDPSDRLLEIARKKVPTADFITADALTYDYPKDIDVIYAFASLLHVNKSDMPTVLGKISTALKVGGILYISLKEKPSYTEEIKSDEYGERMFYFYTPSLISEIAGSDFKTAYEDRQHIGNTDWFTLALQKI